MKKKQTQIKSKKHKALSIVLPVIGGAALVTAATVGTIYALKGNNAPVAPEQTKVVMNPGDEEAKMVFTFSDDIADNKVLASLKELSTASNAIDTPTVVFANGTLKQDITVKDGKAEVRVKLLNPPSEKGTFKYNFTMYFKYTTAESNEEIVREVKNLELEYTNEEEKVYITDPTSQLIQSVPLNPDRSAKVIFKGFKYQGNLTKANLNIETDFGAEYAFEDSFELNERNKTIDITIKIKQGYSGAVNGSFKFYFNGEIIHTTEFKVVLTEDDSIVEPENGSDRYVSISLPNEAGLVKSATFAGRFTYTGIAEAESASDIGVQFSNDGLDPEGVHYSAHVTNLHTGKDEKYFNVEIQVTVDAVEFSQLSYTLNGKLVFTNLKTGNPIKVDAVQTFTINLAALGTVTVPFDNSAMVHQFAKFNEDDDAHQQDDIIFEGFKYSGMDDVADSDEITVNFTPTSGNYGEIYSATVTNLNSRKRSFDVIVHIDINWESHDWREVSGQFDFKRTDDSSLVPVSNPDRNNYSFHLGTIDTVTAPELEERKVKVKPDKTGIATVSFEDFSFTGLEWTEDFTWQRDNLEIDASGLNVEEIDGVALKSAKIYPELPKYGDDNYGLFTLQLQFEVADTTLTYGAITGNIRILEKDPTNFVPLDTGLLDESYYSITICAVDSINDDSTVKVVKNLRQSIDPNHQGYGHVSQNFTYRYSGLAEHDKNLRIDVSGFKANGTIEPTVTDIAWNNALSEFTITLTWAGLTLHEDYVASGQIDFYYDDEITPEKTEALLLRSTGYDLTIQSVRYIDDTAVTHTPETSWNENGEADIYWRGFKFGGFKDDPTLTGLSISSSSISFPTGIKEKTGSIEIVNKTSGTFDVHMVVQVDEANGGSIATNYSFGGESTDTITFAYTDTDAPLDKTTFTGFGGTIKPFAYITTEPEEGNRSIVNVARVDGTQTGVFASFKAEGFGSASKRGLLQVGSTFESTNVQLTIENWREDTTSETDDLWLFDVRANITGVTAEFNATSKLNFSINGHPIYTTANNYSIDIKPYVAVSEPVNKIALVNFTESKQYSFEFKGFQITGMSDPVTDAALVTHGFDSITDKTSTLSKASDGTYTITLAGTVAAIGNINGSWDIQYKNGPVFYTTGQFTAVAQTVSVAITGTTTMNAGDKTPFTAKVSSGDESITPDQTVTWSIPEAQQTIATVNANTGLVTAISGGTATLTATSIYGVSNSVSLTINNVITSIEVPLPTGTTMGTDVSIAKADFKIGYNGQAATAIESMDEVELVSSVAGIVQLNKAADGYTIVPLTAGTTMLTAYDTATHKVHTSALFTVDYVYPTSVSIAPEKTTINVAETEDIQLLDSEDQAFVADPNIVSGISWKSSDPSVLSIIPDPDDATKAEIAGLKGGKSTISADVYLTNGTKISTTGVEITVNAANMILSANNNNYITVGGGDTTITVGSTGQGTVNVTNVTVSSDEITKSFTGNTITLSASTWTGGYPGVVSVTVNATCAGSPMQAGAIQLIVVDDSYEALSTEDRTDLPSVYTEGTEEEYDSGDGDFSIAGSLNLSLLSASEAAGLDSIYLYVYNAGAPSTVGNMNETGWKVLLNGTDISDQWTIEQGITPGSQQHLKYGAAGGFKTTDVITVACTGNNAISSPYHFCLVIE